MKTNYRVVPLPTEVAEAARRGAKVGASNHAVVEVDTPSTYPCRHCLQWAQPGERVVLFPYQSVPSDRPYGEIGPIFVHANACARYSTTDQYPVEFRRHRVLRAYNAAGDMIDAIVVEDDQPEPVIAKLLQNPETAFLQARSVTRGCYTFRIERA